eukprot:5488773-Karenia_brevis.AAC.1
MPSASEDNTNDDESVADSTDGAEGFDEIQKDLERTSAVLAPDMARKRPAAACTEQASTGNTSDEVAGPAPVPKMNWRRPAAARMPHTNFDYSSEEMVD